MSDGPLDDRGLTETTPGSPLSVNPIGETFGRIDVGALLDVDAITRPSGPAPAGTPTLAPPDTRIGRFFVLRELGRGAMGVVLAAYDEMLDRKVALKLLHVDGGPTPADARTMLLREAQALGRLTHPNVVGVYEVGVCEVGVYEGEVFVAMEYVQGSDLRAWLAAAPRGWREIVGVFLQAGAGLYAAHRRGLVHRDFKPTNVLVGDDGRVRVADFGLAAQRARVEGRGDEPTPAISVLDGTIGGVGTLVGTPAYLAPELYRHEGASPRSDQFAFCVALWEALYGGRPFAGRDSLELAVAVETTELPSAAQRPDVPGWLHALLLRGLARDPSRRFPSMAELLAALEPRPPRRPLLALLLPALALAVMAGFLVMPGKTCPNSQELAAQLWPADHRAAVEGAFARERMAPLGAQVARRLDAYAATWSEAAATSCIERGADDPRLADARTRCLARARERFVVLRTELGRGGSATLRAQAQIDALPDVAACGDVALADLECSAEPTDPAARRDGARGWARLDEAARRELAGDYRGAIAEVRGAVAVFDALPGSGARIHARSHLGRLLHASDDPLAALPVLLAARDEAEKLHCDAPLIGIYDRLINIAAYNPAVDRGEAGAWLDLLALRVAVAGKPIDRDVVDHDRGLLAFYRDADLELAARALHEALRRQQAADATATRRHSDTLRLLGLVEMSRGELDAAAERFVRARDTWAAATSPVDPELWKPEFNLGLVARTRGDLATAKAQFTKALGFIEAGLGRDSMPAAKCLATLAVVAEDENDAGTALKYAGEALAISDNVLVPDDPRRVEYLEAYAEMLTTAGRPAEAIPLMQEALVLLAGEPATRQAWSHLALARAFTDRSDFTSALFHARFAAEHAEDHIPGAGDLRASAESFRGRAALELGLTAEALASLEEAIRRWSLTPENRINLAFTRFHLARGLCILGDRTERPASLVALAREELRSDEQTSAIRTWTPRNNCTTPQPTARQP